MSNEYIDDTYAVSHDGKVKYTGNYNSCYTWLLDNQPFSTAWAMKYEGWDITKT